MAQVAFVGLLWQLPMESVAQLLNTVGMRPSAFLGSLGGLGDCSLGEAVLTAPSRLFDDVVLPLCVGPWLAGGVVQLALGLPFVIALGRRLEARGGSFAFLSLYVLGGVVGNLVELGLRAEQATPMVGATGAISAVVGAYAVLERRARVQVVVPVVVVPVLLNLPAVTVVVAWFVLQFEPIQRLMLIGPCQPLSYVGLGAGFAVGLFLGPLLLGRRTTGAG